MLAMNASKIILISTPAVQPRLSVKQLKSIAASKFQSIGEQMKRSVFAHDTNRITHVTLRFFMFLMSFATFKLASGQNLKEKGQ